MAPGYLKTFRQAIRKPEGYEISERNEISGADEGLNSFNSFISYPTPRDLSSRNAPPDGGIDHTSLTHQAAFDTLERRCPDYVPNDRWQQAVEDARQFLAAWGARAQSFGWTEHELFGLHPVPERPAANYDRLGRLDDLGLIWLLRGRPVITLTSTEAIIRCPSGANLTYRRRTEPAPATAAPEATP
jgi:hypothetical protein